MRPEALNFRIICFSLALGPIIRDIGDAYEIGGARPAERQAGNDNHALAGFGEPFLKRDTAVWSRASSSMTQWMPQTTDNFRPAASIGEIATIGHFGRSRDTRRPVEPEQVQQTIAARSSVSATWRVAAAIASAPVRSGSVCKTCSDGK